MTNISMVGLESSEHSILSKIDQHLLADCPASYGTGSCSNPDFIRPSFGLLPVPFSIFSCSMSVVGSILTVLPYLLWKDIRNQTLRKVITFLAIADFFTASGYIMASINYLTFINKRKLDDVHACVTFDAVCQIQAYISSWSSYSAFWWTCILAFFFYNVIVKGDIRKINRFFPLYHILAWGSPIFVMFPLLVTGSLGYSLFAAGGWCFIKGEQKLGPTSYTDFSMNYETILKILIGGKALEIFTYIWVIVFYVLIRVNIKRKQMTEKKYVHNNNNGVASVLLKKVELKLSFIPVAFVFFRMWGTLQFFFSIVVFQLPAIDSTGCVPYGIYIVLKVFAVLQAIGDGAQGWVNAILYIFWSPRIRERLFVMPVKCITRDETIPTDRQPISNNRKGNTGAATSKSNTSFRIMFNANAADEEIFDYDNSEMTPSISSVSVIVDS